jgi:hypothetical protein
VYFHSFTSTIHFSNSPETNAIMDTHQGIKLDFGPSPTSVFRTAPWPFQENTDSADVIKKVICVSAGDSLVLHLHLDNFQWDRSHVLLVLIAKNQEQVPSAYFIHRGSSVETRKNWTAIFHHLQNSGKTFGNAQFSFSQSSVTVSESIIFLFHN